jgi:hypothetical protein
MVSEFAIGYKVRGLKPGGVDGVLKAMQVRSTTSFGGEAMLSVLCQKILQHAKEPFEL